MDKEINKIIAKLEGCFGIFDYLLTPVENNLLVSYIKTLQQQCKKQKEVIDKIASNIKNDIDGFMTINDHGECNDILDLLNIYLDILNEVTNNE